MNYTLGFQRALHRSLVLETAYVGTRGVKFNLYRNFNDVDRVTGLRPNPNDITGPYLDNSGQSNYNSWQTSLRQRMTRGLLFNLHHTWGKASLTMAAMLPRATSAIHAAMFRILLW